MSQMITYNQRLPRELLEQLDAELAHARAATPRLSRSALVREMLEAELQRRQAQRGQQ
jgi:metal-responsive CopG/Arc/MetJ family transcriptional regulator